MSAVSGLTDTRGLWCPSRPRGRQYQPLSRSELLVCLPLTLSSPLYPASARGPGGPSCREWGSGPSFYSGRQKTEISCAKHSGVAEQETGWGDALFSPLPAPGLQVDPETSPPCSFGIAQIRNGGSVPLGLFLGPKGSVHPCPASPWRPKSEMKTSFRLDATAGRKFFHL